VSTYTDHEISSAEAVTLGATDPLFFASYFFPKAAKMRAPVFHREIWETLVDPMNRHVAIEVFRGGAKTTILRMFTAMRIAYGLSRTILFVSASQKHSAQSVDWLKKAVEYNHGFAKTFGLRPGNKWTGEDIEIIHGTAGHTVRVLALGITGQTRGINIDDHRPDLIVVDDPCDEENTATPEQRLKTSNLFFGALDKSLVPATENPHAKMVLLQTPLHKEDLVESCLRDPTWVSHRFGCFDRDQRSRWEERFTTEELRKQKEAHIARNQLSLWYRELECKITAPELSAFHPEWLQFWDILPDGMATYMAIDPAPPMSEEAKRKGRDTDWQAIVVIGLHKGNAYLVDYALAKDQNPEQLSTEFFRMALKYRPRMVGVESVAYQRTLAWFLRQKMIATGHHFYIHEIVDRRKKNDRIRQALTGRASNGALHVNKSHIEFIQEFSDYPDVSHDDLLDAVSMALDLAGPGAGIIDVEDYHRIEDEEKLFPDLPDWRICE